MYSNEICLISCKLHMMICYVFKSYTSIPNMYNIYIN